MSARENGAKVRGRGFPELKNRDLKERAVAFYAEHKVQDALERLLNEMFLSEPKDVYGYMSEYFHGLSLQPVISTLSAHEGLDSAGGKSLELDIHCTVNGIDKLTSSTSLSLDMYNLAIESLPLVTSPATKGATRKASPKAKSSKSSLEQGELTGSHASTGSNAVTVLGAMTSIKKYICSAVSGLTPYKLDEVDQALCAIKVEDDCSILHPSALLATSFATAIAGANLSDTPLYLHLSKLVTPPPSTNHSLPSTPIETTSKTPNSRRRKSSNPHKFTMPIPVVGALSGGHLGCGKVKFREFCLSPLPGTPFPEQIRMIVSVHNELGKTLTGKYGPSGQSSLNSGSYCPVIDKPEQALDFIQDAAKNAGFELNEGIGVMIDVGAEKLFDEEKGKYELISGQWKTSDDVINVYADLLRSYPGLIGFIDPLHHNDINGWKKLQERLGNNCFLIADNTLKHGLPVHHVPNQNTESTTELESGGPEEEVLDATDNEKANGVVEDVQPSLSYLSCAAITLETTLSGTMCKATHIKEHSYYVMLRVPPNSTMNTLPSDLSVAMMCRFIRLGAPTGLTSSGILTRLVRIREELVAKKLHDPAGAHVFTCTPDGD